MATHTTDQQIRVRIDSFLTELSGLVRKAALDAVQEALAGGATTRRHRGPGRPRGAAKRRRGRPRKATVRAKSVKRGKRIRRSTADLDKIAARVLTQVKSKAGQRLEEIGKALKTDTSILKRPVSMLLTAKKLRTEGQKRGTKYFAGGARGSPSRFRGKAKARTRRKGKPAKKISRKRAARRVPRADAPGQPAAAAA